MKLLIVDDEARIRALIAKYAAFEGYETEEAENGMQAILKCREKHYDLVIMDVMMPELDGFSAVREIRKNDNVPVIMLSARGEEYDRIHGFEIGVDDYVTFGLITFGWAALFFALFSLIFKNFSSRCRNIPF